MKNKAFRFLVSFLAVLLLVSCSAKQDFSTEIENKVSSEFSKRNIDSDFNAPKIFKNCETDKNSDIEVKSSDNGISVIQQGNIKSHETGLNYSDIEIRILNNSQDVIDSKDPEKSLAEYVSLWSSEADVEFNKHTIDGKSYYIVTTFDKSKQTNIFNLLCFNGANPVLVIGTVNEANEISRATEQKICEDFIATDN